MASRHKTERTVLFRSANIYQYLLNIDHTDSYVVSRANVSLYSAQKSVKYYGFGHDDVKYLASAFACNPMLPGYRAALFKGRC